MDLNVCLFVWSRALFVVCFCTFSGFFLRELCEKLPEASVCRTFGPRSGALFVVYCLLFVFAFVFLHELLKQLPEASVCHTFQPRSGALFVVYCLFWVCLFV